MELFSHYFFSFFFPFNKFTDDTSLCGTHPIAHTTIFQELSRKWLLWLIFLSSVYRLHSGCQHPFFEVESFYSHQKINCISPWRKAENGASFRVNLFCYSLDWATALMDSTNSRILPSTSQAIKTPSFCLQIMNICKSGVASALVQMDKI